MTEIQIKLSAEQHDFLLARLGSEEDIRQYIQAYIDQKVEELASWEIKYSLKRKKLLRIIWKLRLKTSIFTFET